MKENLLKIINHYGLMEQLKYIHSEYFELDEAIFEERAYQMQENEVLPTNFYINNIIEEIADVLVMLRQIQYYYGISDEDIEAVMNYKIARQLDRIKGEYNEIK